MEAPHHWRWDEGGDVEDWIEGFAGERSTLRITWPGPHHQREGERVSSGTRDGLDVAIDLGLLGFAFVASCFYSSKVPCYIRSFLLY